MRMGYSWLEGYCLSMPFATREYKPDWDATLNKVGRRMFALWSDDKAGRPIVSFKLDPLFGEMLRHRYADIVPGYHLNKTHWSSLYLDGEVPDDIVRSMVDESYRLVWGKLSKREQREVMGPATSIGPEDH